MVYYIYIYALWYLNLSSLTATQTLDPAVSAGEAPLPRCCSRLQLGRVKGFAPLSWVRRTAI